MEKGVKYIVPIPKWVGLMVAGHARRRRGLDLIAAQAALDKSGNFSGILERGAFKRPFSCFSAEPTNE